MKTEQSIFKLCAVELCREGLLSNTDVSRIQRSLIGKGHGFIHDLCCLANCIRLGLSTGKFSLCAHTRNEFQVIPHSVLPKFLGGALKRIFSPDGTLKDQFDDQCVSQLLMFLDSLKKQTPSVRRAKKLEADLWSGLTSRMVDENPQTVQAFLDAFHEDPDLRRFYKRVRSRFRHVMARADMTDVAFATGPGSNLDKHPAITSSDWSVSASTFIHSGFAHDPIFQEVVKNINRVPFQDDWETFASYVQFGESKDTYSTDKPYDLKPFDFSMRCSAQPKSYKALRGVGVMHSLRMAYQLSLQRIFYKYCLDESMPLTDQGVMSNLLRSEFWNVGTIDLTNATDYQIWDLMFAAGRGVPLFDAMYASRTKELTLPSGETIPCTAPVMGEGITFCLLSAWTNAIYMAVCDEIGSGHSLVRNYGDDGITCYYQTTIRRLEQMGFKVSHTKSYPPSSHFKESCEGHFVSRADKEPLLCKPLYIPPDLDPRASARTTLSARNIFRLLTASKKAYRGGNFALPAAIKAEILNRTRIKELPTVHFQSDLIGHPSSTGNCLEFVFTSKAEETFVLSERGMVRNALRAIDTNSSHLDPKVNNIREYEKMTRTIKGYKIHNAMKSLETEIFRRILELENPAVYSDLIARKLAPNDIKSWVISNLDEDTIVTYIEYFVDLIVNAKPPSA